MTHPEEEGLLLYAYGEIDEPEVARLAEHVASCGLCFDRLKSIERGRRFAELAFRPRAKRRLGPSVAAALAVAAAFAGILLVPEPRTTGTAPLAGGTGRSGSVGYLTGGPDLGAVDSILRRLEQEVSNASH